MFTELFKYCKIKKKKKVKYMYYLFVQESCTVDISSRNKEGDFVISIEVQDYQDVTSTNPKSSIPLQFSIEVRDLGAKCQFKSFIFPTPSSGEVHNAYTGTLCIFQAIFTDTSATLR